MLAVYPWIAARIPEESGLRPTQGSAADLYACNPSPKTDWEREGLHCWRSKGLKCCENKTLPALCLGLPPWGSQGVHKEESTGPFLAFLHKQENTSN